MAAASEIERLAESLSGVVREISAAAWDFVGPVKVECLGLARKVSLLSHLLEEMREFSSEDQGLPLSFSSSSSPAASPASFLGDLLLALEVTSQFLSLQRPSPPSGTTLFENVGKITFVQFKYVTWQLERALGNLPYDFFHISDEVREQVELVCTQLRRATEKNGCPDLNIFSEIHRILSWTRGKQASLQSSGRLFVSQVENAQKVVCELNGKSHSDAEIMTFKWERLDGCGYFDFLKAVELDEKVSSLSRWNMDEVKKPDSLVIPEDFRCPISLELMRDPVIVSTGQTYERSFIQRWIDCGNLTCPKTRQKLQNLALTPNYVLRTLIMQWCEANKIEQPHRSMSRIRNDGSYDGRGDRAAVSELVHKLSSRSNEEQRSAVAEIRSLAKRSSDSRILIAEAGAIPILVHLVAVDDLKTQENAVTALLNLSIHENNKVLIMLAGAITPIIQVLRVGNMEARENAAATIFSLSLLDENKITIGGTEGAMEALVELLQSGSSRGKKDAATALFNLCIYQGNKARAVRVGILGPLLVMLKDSSSNSMVDEALTILSVLVSHQEGKVAIAQAKMIPVLIDLLRTGQPRIKENTAAILLSLCKKDSKNLAFIGRLGASQLLMELSKSGTDRAKLKATSLLGRLGRLQTF